MISRRALLAIPFAAACSTRGGTGFRGYAFIANQDGQAVAAVDLQAMAVARHIPLDGSPGEVLAAQSRPVVYALTPDNGTIHEIRSDRLSFVRKLAVAQRAVAMYLTRDERTLYVLASQPASLVRVAATSLQVEWSLALPDLPAQFAVTADGRTAAISMGLSIRLVDLAARQLSSPIGTGDFGAVLFLADGKTLIAANRADRLLSLYDVGSARLIANLPLAVRPDHVCLSRDDGQLFVTGEGTDAVVIVFPHHTPQVYETVLAGHGLGAMAASDSLLFIASPASGSVSIFDIASERFVTVVPVGSDPGFVTITPDDQYPLVLNRNSGDVAVLSQSSRTNKWGLLTVIPVGSRPVHASVRGV